MRGVSLAIAVALAAIMVSCTSSGPSRATSTSTPSAGIASPLTVSGNQILDANGRPVVLRGLARAWLNFKTYIGADSRLDDANFDTMKSWGANIVRIYLGQQFWLSNECEYVNYFPRKVDQVVDMITSRGMVALLDLNWNTRNPCLQSKSQKMADSGSIQFWREVADRYKGNPLVAFDLYNEPHGITWQVWRDGGQVVDNDLTWTAAGMQQMYDAVRATGAHNLVFVSGNGWANTPPSGGALLTGDNIVYATHWYTCPAAPPPTCTAADPYNPAPPGKRLNAWLPLLASHPVVITEFGWPDSNDGTYNKNVIDWAASHKVGWIAYHWGIGNGTKHLDFGLLTDWDTWTPTPAGAPVKEALGQAPTQLLSAGARLAPQPALARRRLSLWAQRAGG
jgi:endoglucanase